MYRTPQSSAFAPSFFIPHERSRSPSLTETAHHQETLLRSYKSPLLETTTSASFDSRHCEKHTEKDRFVSRIYNETRQKQNTRSKMHDLCLAREELECTEI